jgi:hypothetical protein
VWQIDRPGEWIGDIDSTHIMWTYDQLRTGDPRAVVAMNFAPAHMSEDLEQWKSDITGYLPATDVVMFAAYPYPPGLRNDGITPTCGPKNVIGYPECKMDRLVIAADIFRNELNRPGQPLWMIIQAFKNIPYKEMKWEAVASIVHGATGILWAGWTWDWWDDDKEIRGSGIDNWPVTREVMSEIAGLQGILTGYDIPGANTDHPDVESRAMRGRGRQAALFAISRNGYAGSARLRIPGAPPGLTEVSVRGELRSVTVENGWITDWFDGYEAHIYRYGLNSELPLPPDGDPTSAPDVAGANEPFGLRVLQNPARGSAFAEFHLPRPGAVVFTIYDTAGRRVALAGSGRYEAGSGTIVWNGRDYYGEPVAPGMYFVRATTSRGEVATAKVLLQR